mmetsp:Transcript_13818/g.38108  ORF Transcript_13818/g.38108 Transcript_13818/m.38108 type:complete len:203 (-) Transcript_13818:753-1361(-)
MLWAPAPRPWRWSKLQGPPRWRNRAPCSCSTNPSCPTSTSSGARPCLPRSHRDLHEPWAPGSRNRPVLARSNTSSSPQTTRSSTSKLLPCNRRRAPYDATAPYDASYSPAAPPPSPMRPSHHSRRPNDRSTTISCPSSSSSSCSERPHRVPRRRPPSRPGATCRRSGSMRPQTPRTRGCRCHRRRRPKGGPRSLARASASVP